MVQARLGSVRFNDKVLKKINNQEIIKIQYKRLQKIKSKKKIIFLIPDNKKNITLRKFLKKNKIEYFLGSEKNVLDRYYQSATEHKAKFIIRLTADCPLIDYRLVDKLITLFKKKKVDYVSNIIKRTFPHGMDMEMFTYRTLERLWKEVKSKDDKEHVTSYLVKNKNNFSTKNFINSKNQSSYRITVDYAEDLRVISKIINHFKKNIYFSSNQIVNFLKNNSDVTKLNKIFKLY
tara:strand:- start:30 stop:731 length:702 start_codon:yes stop_codon:yes gene_type:complete